MFQTKEIENRYKSAYERYTIAMDNNMPDRIPIRFLFEEFAAKYAGYTTQQTACDFRLAFDATRKTADELGVDAAMLNAIWSNYGVGKGASWKYFAVPGVDVPVTGVCQFHEPSLDSELCMHDDEYDEFADDPTAFLMTKWLSRYTTRLSPFGSPATFEHNTALITGAMAYQRYISSFGEYGNKLKYEAGVVSANAGMIKAPFDLLMDKLRGYQGSVMDAMTQPDKVRKACEALIPHIVKNALGGADPDKVAPITIWAHRGTVPFITPEMFDTILWPTLKPVFDEIISKGYRILFYGEGNWEAHYNRLMELPAGSIIYHLDKGDPVYLAKTLKTKFAVSGGLSYEVLARGSKDDVEKSLKKLFDTLAPEGGYMLDCSALMMHDLDIENIKTAINYTKEHGVYSRSSGITNKRDDFVFKKGNIVEKRPAGICIPWEKESKNYAHLSGDTELVKNSWEEVDSWVYNYIWTTLLW